MRGRKPKPTWLKVVSGNPGRRPLPVDEPVPDGDLTDPPDWLSASQQERWRYAIEHAPMGLLKRLDQCVLVAWAVAADLHRDAADKVSRFGSVVKSPANGMPMQSPYVSILNKQAQIMLKCAAEMGFSPSSRSRVSLKAQQATDNPFENLRTIGDD